MKSIESLTLSNVSEHERELTVTVPEGVVNHELNDAINKIQRTASRKGFRPGKMPKNMVLNFYKGEIEKNLIEKLIEKSFDLACQEQELIPVSEPKMETLGEISKDKPFTYKALFQVKPKVDTPEYIGLEAEIRKFTFDESDIADELNNLRENLATFAECPDREMVQDNDLVHCDSVVFIDGVINPKYSHSDYAVPLFAENIPEDLKSALVGKKVGEEASVNYKMPEDHQDQDISGKDCQMRLTVKSFKERVLPDLDDDLAKDLSDKFTCLDDVKESIKLRFEITAKRRDEFFKDEALTKALVERNPLDIPPALVERMAMSLINRELGTMKESVAKDIVKHHWQEMWQSVQERALFRVKAELLFEALIDHLEISASDEETASVINKNKNISKSDATYSVQVQKLLDAIHQKAHVTIKEEPLFKKAD